MSENETPKKEKGVTLKQLTLAVQEMAHFSGQERVLDKYGIPRMENAAQSEYRKK